MTTSALQFNLEFSAAAMPGSYAHRGFYQAQRVSGPSRGSVHDFAIALRQKGFGKFLAEGDLVFYHVLGDTRFQIAGDEPVTQLTNVPIIGVDILPSQGSAGRRLNTAGVQPTDHLPGNGTQVQEPVPPSTSSKKSRNAADEAANIAAEKAAQVVAERAEQASAEQAAAEQAAAEQSEKDADQKHNYNTRVTSTRVQLPLGVTPLESAEQTDKGARPAPKTSPAAPPAAHQAGGHLQPPDSFPGVVRDLSLGPPKGLSRSQRITFWLSFPQEEREAVCGTADWCKKWQNILTEGGRWLPDATDPSQPYAAAAGYRCHACRVQKYMWSFADDSDQLKDGGLAVCDHCLTKLTCSSCDKIKSPKSFSWTQREKHANRKCKQCVEKSLRKQERENQQKAMAEKQAAATAIQAAWRRALAYRHYCELWCTQHDLDLQEQRDAEDLEINPDLVERPRLRDAADSDSDSNDGSLSEGGREDPAVKNDSDSDGGCQDACNDETPDPASGDSDVLDIPTAGTGYQFYRDLYDREREPDIVSANLYAGEFLQLTTATDGSLPTFRDSTSTDPAGVEYVMLDYSPEAGQLVVVVTPHYLSYTDKLVTVMVPEGDPYEWNYHAHWGSEFLVLRENLVPCRAADTDRLHSSDESDSDVGLD